MLYLGHTHIRTLISYIHVFAHIALPGELKKSNTRRLPKGARMWLETLVWLSHCSLLCFSASLTENVPQCLKCKAGRLSSPDQRQNSATGLKRVRRPCLGAVCFQGPGTEAWQSFGFGLAWFGLGFGFGFGFLVQATHCWPLADMHSDTDKPTTFSKWRVIWHELLGFCYPKENLYHSNGKTPFPPQEGQTLGRSSAKQMAGPSFCTLLFQGPQPAYLTL